MYIVVWKMNFPSTGRKFLRVFRYVHLPILGDLRHHHQITTGCHRETSIFQPGKVVQTKIKISGKWHPARHSKSNVVFFALVRCQIISPGNLDESDVICCFDKALLCLAKPIQRSVTHCMGVDMVMQPIKDLDQKISNKIHHHWGENGRKEMHIVDILKFKVPQFVLYLYTPDGHCISCACWPNINVHMQTKQGRDLDIRLRHCDLSFASLG